MIRSEPRARDIVVYLLTRNGAMAEADAEKMVRRVELDVRPTLPECPSCDDSWAAHVAGLHAEDDR